jgi:hypothetical protein
MHPVVASLVCCLAGEDPFMILVSPASCSDEMTGYLVCGAVEFELS